MSEAIDKSKNPSLPGKKAALAVGVLAAGLAAAFLAGRASGPSAPAPAAFAPAAPMAAPAAPPAQAAPAAEPPAAFAAPGGALAEPKRGPTKEEIAKGMRTYALTLIEVAAGGLAFVPDPAVARKVLSNPKIAEGLLMLEASRRGCGEADEACKGEARAAAKAVHDSVLASPDPAAALQESLKPYRANTFMPAR